MTPRLFCPHCGLPDTVNFGEALRLEEDESAVLYCGRCDEKYRVWSVNGLFEVEAMEE